MCTSVCVGASDKEVRVSERKDLSLLFKDTCSVFCITYKNSETESLNYVRGVPAGGYLQQAALILPQGSSLIFPKREWVSRGVQSAKKNNNNSSVRSEMCCCLDFKLKVAVFCTEWLLLSWGSCLHLSENVYSVKMKTLIGFIFDVFGFIQRKGFQDCTGF